MFGALRERDFRLLFTGQTISLIGSSITTIALAFAVLGISPHHYAVDYGIVGAAGLAPLVPKMEQYAKPVNVKLIGNA